MELKKNRLIEIYFYIIIFLKIIELTVIVPNDNIINIIMVAMGVLLLLYIFIKNGFKIDYNYSKELKLYIICIILTLIFNWNIRTIKSTIFQIFYIVVLFLLSQKFIDQKIYKNINIIIISTTIIIVTVFFIQHAITNEWLFTNINGGSLLVALNICILLFMKNKNNHMLQVGKWGLVIYYSIFMLMFGSRTAILSLISIFAILLLRRFFCVKYVKSIILLLFILILILTIFLFLNQADLNTGVKIMEENVNMILSNRYYLWKYSISNLEGKFLFGVGADIEGKIIEKVPEDILSTLSASQKNIMSRTNVHNGYIQILVQNGVIGLILILLFIYKNMKMVKNEKESKYFLIFFIIINLCENVLLLSNSLVVLLIWMNFGINYRKYFK